MRILDIVKPDLRDVRNQLASDLKRFRKDDPTKALLALKRFQAGMKVMEANLNKNLFYSQATRGGLSDLL